MNAPSLLLFDLGGVLIERAAFDNLSRLLPERHHPNHIKERWLVSPSVRKFEKGRSCASEFADNFIREWNLNISPDVFLDEFSAWPRAFYPGAQELILELGQHYRVGCLSNSNPLHWEKFSAELTEMFDITLCSHLLGSVKPDRDIFLKALEQCRVAPHEVYFFDDCFANVKTALALNINAFCVTDFTSLMHILQGHGLVPSESRFPAVLKAL